MVVRERTSSKALTELRKTLQLELRETVSIKYRIRSDRLSFTCLSINVNAFKEFKTQFRIPLLQGDGESEPHTPPSELQDESQGSDGGRRGRRISSEADETEGSFGEISFRLDLVAVALFVLSAATRFYNLAYPQNIV
jgi:hypothetical protein